MRTSRLAIRWRTPQLPVIALSLGAHDILGLEAEQSPGRLALRACARLPLGEAIQLDLSARRVDETGALLVALDSNPEIEIGWKESRFGAQGGLSWRWMSWGTLRVAIAREEGDPDSLEDHYRLRTHSTASRWTLDWRPQIAGPSVSLLAHHASISSRATVDTSGSSRTFHNASIRASTLGWNLGWVAPSWSFESRWRDHVIEIPPSGYFAPFLSWNVFDPSPWGPVDQILSDQREHVQGTLELRRAAVTARRRATWGPLGMDLSLEASWWALDPFFVHRTTNLAFLGIGYDVVSDTTGNPRIRAWTLSPATRLVLDGGAWGTFSTGGSLTVPIHFRRLRGADPPPIPVDGSRDEELRGLWSLHAGWHRDW